MKRRSHMTAHDAGYVVFSLRAKDEFILSAQTLEYENNLGVQSWWFAVSCFGEILMIRGKWALFDPCAFFLCVSVRASSAAWGFWLGGGRPAGWGAQRSRRGRSAQRVPQRHAWSSAAQRAVPRLPARQLWAHTHTDTQAVAEMLPVLTIVSASSYSTEGSRPASVPTAPPVPAASLQLWHAVAPSQPLTHGAELRPGCHRNKRRGGGRIAVHRRSLDILTMNLTNMHLVWH